MSLEMPTRRIQKTGYTYMISLPKIWLHNWNLKRFDSVDMEIDNERRLILKPSKCLTLNKKNSENNMYNK
ncbi:MAG: AbrB/MazE/SpoVT family DNA-binding domain-containing protein [Nanoarchaeota archaeon]|nr:AbrB/MazE/SpoVT family DNA-binding domain-containing protein [Nanoarchaeota archaeon]MBU1850534.1 AbrB/MazE/SpoVT family DNA-binding domain-containing protein [Nanoarchaeota archaeon]